MSWQATTWVVKHSKTEGSRYLVMLMLANRADVNGCSIYPSFTTLAAECRMSRRHVIRLVKSLVEQGELRQLPTYSPAGTNMYEIPMDTSDNLSLAVAGDISASAGDISSLAGDISALASDTAMSPELSLEQSLEQPFEQKTRSAPESAPTPDQKYLLRRLFEANSNWSEVTIPAIVQLNQKWGTEVVRTALGRLRESMPETRKPYGLLAAVCAEIAKESA